MNRLQLATAAILAGLLAACSSDGDGTSPATSASATSSTSTTGSGGGSSVSSGTGGSTSSTGTGEGTGTAGGGGAGGSIGACAFGDAGACPDGEYCDAPDCKTGTCAPLGVEDGDAAPVCGCDDVTYWNGNTAASHGMAVAASGECVTGTPCGGSGNVQCAAGQSCNIALDGPAACGPDASGTCWGMPTDCPIGIGFGANRSTCDGDPWCTESCAIIKSGEPWFSDDTCPL
jgi:hypothetical protein